jgi:hypothetical protein
MKVYNYNNELLNILMNELNKKNPQSKYKISINEKYSVNNIVDIILDISIKDMIYPEYYKLPLELIKYFKGAIYSKYTQKIIIKLVKNNISINTNVINKLFLNTYIVVGYDVPLKINELTVIV